MNALLIILPIVALLVGAAITYFAMKARFAAGEARLQPLLDERATLQGTIASLRSTADELQTEKQSLLAKHSSSEAEVRMLRSHADEAEAMRRELEERLTQQQQAMADLQSQREAAQKEVSLLKEQCSERDKTLQKRDSDIASLNSSIIEQKDFQAQLQATLEAQRKELDLSAQRSNEKEERITHLQDELGTHLAQVEQLRDALAQTTSARDTAMKEVALLKEQMEQQAKERTEAFNQQLLMAKEQLQNATQEILKQREEALHKANTEQMDSVVKPLNDTLQQMRESLTESLKTSTEGRTSIEKSIELLVRQTKEIGEGANNLAHALRNESKTQGNWGELILESILEHSGLKEGVHYEKQVTLRDADGRAVTHDETGKRLIPDVVVHYPDNKDVVIDSKVSLTAYLDYCEATTDEARDLALARHLTSVRSHVKELYGKDYSSYIKPPRTSLDYTIMFIPNESAMQLALLNDQKLWREAFDRRIFITSEQNLLALLRMIQLAWTQVQQARNQEEVFDTAQRLLERVGDFVDRFGDIGERLTKAVESFDHAKKKLYTGPQSIVKAANDMVKLRVKSRKPIPEAQEWLPFGETEEVSATPQPTLPMPEAEASEVEESPSEGEKEQS